MCKVASVGQAEGTSPVVRTVQTAERELCLSSISQRRIAAYDHNHGRSIKVSSMQLELGQQTHDRTRVIAREGPRG